MPVDPLHGDRVDRPGRRGQGAGHRFGRRPQRQHGDPGCRHAGPGQLAERRGRAGAVGPGQDPCLGQAQVAGLAGLYPPGAANGPSARPPPGHVRRGLADGPARRREETRPGGAGPHPVGQDAGAGRLVPGPGGARRRKPPSTAIAIAEKIVRSEPRAVAAAMQQVLQAGASRPAGRAGQVAPGASGAQGPGRSSTAAPSTAGKAIPPRRSASKTGPLSAARSRQRVPHNAFLCTTKSYTNFVLRAECKLLGNANGGIQFRSQRVPNHYEVSGFQADMDTGPDGGYWGSLYDESRRNRQSGGARQGVAPHAWSSPAGTSTRSAAKGRGSACSSTACRRSITPSATRRSRRAASSACKSTAAIRAKPGIAIS